MDKLTHPVRKGDITQPAVHAAQQASLENLSNEIIVLVAQNIRALSVALFSHPPSYYSCNKTLLSFMLCSRRLRSLVEPVLYEEFNEIAGTRSKPEYHNIGIFLCRLVARPDLAAKVKRIEVQGQHSERDASGEIIDGLEVSMIKDEDWTQFRDVIRRLTNDEETTQNSLWEMKKGKWEAFFVVMLCVLPSLQQVVCRDWGHFDDNFDFLNSLLGIAAHQQMIDPGNLKARCYLPRLEEVTLKFHDTEGCMGPKIMFPWMGLPSVHTITASAISVNSEDDEDVEFDVDEMIEVPPQVWRDEFPNIKSLTLENSNLNGIDIAKVLRTLTNIEYLEYWHGGATVSHGDFHAARMMYGISVAKHTLKHLYITDMDMSSDESILKEINGISLKDFTQLETIHTYPAAFLGRNEESAKIIINLPPNLESLSIYEGKHDCMSAAITHLLKDISSFPSLKSINLNWRLITYPDTPFPRLADIIPGFDRNHALHLLDLCKEAGIEMILKRSRPPYKLFYDWYDKSKDLSSAGVQNVFVTQYVEYPYEKWDEMCKEFEVNPDTGRRWDSRYPSSGIDWHYAPHYYE